jgi:hypothetical protein
MGLGLRTEWRILYVWAMQGRRRQALEPEVHLIEKYFQEILHCLTSTNMRCKGGKEIDLLAMDPRPLRRSHVESRVATKFILKPKATRRKNEAPSRTGSTT